MTDAPAGSNVVVIEPRIRLIAFDDVQLPTRRRYLVKGLIPRVGLTVVWGPPKSGKSFWTFDLMLHVALGREYRGRRVHPGPVVYCAFEGQTGIEARCAAFAQRFLADDRDRVPFFIEPVTLDLVKDAKELAGAIRLALGDVNPVAIVLDTLNRSLSGSESRDEDMGNYVRAADSLREAFECAVVVVHHCGIDGSRPRGHTSLTGAADAQLSVSRDAADNIVVTVEYAKDGPQGDNVLSRLEVVDIGADDDGEMITSCVVLPVDGAAPVRNRGARKLSDRQRLALDALDECAATTGRAPPREFGLPAGLVAVSLSDWRAELYRAGVLDPDAKNPREDFRRVKTSLQARRLIGARDNLVWRA